MNMLSARQSVIKSGISGWTNESDINKTLKGVLINNHVKSDEKFSFDDISDSLLIYTPDTYETSVPKAEEKEESGFNDKKALKPLLIGTGVILAGCLGLSGIFKSSSKAILKSKSYECLPDLAINNNIRQEPEFAIYRAIRQPNFRNILGVAAVAIMSGITVAAKNFVDGAQEIWLKKKSADVEKELQENLISVETNAFSGKLKVVNEMLSSNMKYFDTVINNKQSQNEDVFETFNRSISFKGKANKQENSNDGDNKKEKIKNLQYILLAAGVAGISIAAGKKSISNIRQAAKNSDNLANNIAQSTVDIIKEKSSKPKEDDLPDIIRYLKSICAKPEFIKEIGQKYNLSEYKINSIINSVEEERKRIFADAPAALGGIPQKLQYYCYIDENRGHLYNWVVNPENKFTKYIFMAFTLSSAVGYLFNKGMDAVKDFAVMKENAKTELDLRKRLVDVEIENFKRKKESAVSPLTADFTSQANSGAKSKEELKQLADNILFEIKNGPPYVYT